MTGLTNLFILAPLAVRGRSALLKNTLLFELFQLAFLNTCALLCTGSSNTGLVSVVLDRQRQDKTHISIFVVIVPS